MGNKDPEVDAFVKRSTNWRAEIKKLRSILLQCGLDEGLKWGKPCFMFEASNVAIIQPFKPHCCLMFFKGALLDDPHGLLRAQGPNTRSALRLEFTGESEIKAPVIKSFVAQAIAVEKAGLEVEPKAKGRLDLPEELARVMRTDRRLAEAFHALTPGRQRAHVLYVAGAKLSKTRTDRIERCAPKILAGKGPNGR